jgi:homoserine dehydrogenase
MITLFCEQYLSILPQDIKQENFNDFRMVRRYIDQHTIKYNNHNITITISIIETSSPLFDIHSVENIMRLADCDL